MKANYDRDALHAAFQLVSSVVPSRSPKPILANVKLVAEDDRSILMATDLESVGVRLEVRGVNTARPGMALLPADRFAAILRETTEEQLNLEADGSRCLIRGQESEFELPSDDPDAYPDVPDFSSEDSFQITASSLREMIARTVFATAQESTRYAMTGVLWEIGPEGIRLVATDGRRLAVADGVGIAHGGHSTEGMTPVVPTKAMNLLERNLTDADEQVYIHMNSNEARFKVGRAVISARLVEGRYPQYRDVVPKKADVKVGFKAGEFLSGVRQAAIPTDQDSRGVTIEFNPTQAVMKSRVADRGRAEVRVPVQTQGEQIGICFDPRYLIEMLRTLDPSTEVSLGLTDHRSAAHFKVGDSYSYVVMPLTRDD